MAKLTKIVVCGFKSFKRKSAIPVQPGISVFTGPNGSGKTNVADAITFVLGRVPSKTLRAAKAEHLIFHGGNKKQAADSALVSLHFDNSAKRLRSEEPEVVISRRINSSGVSTYRVNSRVVTRQQMIDMLLPVGLHPDAHNIIQQGDVTQIVDMGSEGRRKIIDEVSGIAEYDDKKKKAERELVSVDEKVKEGEIIIREKSAVVERLKREHDAAVRFRQVTEELAMAKKAILFKQGERAEKEKEGFEKKLSEKEKEMAKLTTDVEDIEKKISASESEMEKLTKDILKSGEEVEVEKTIARLNGEMERLKDKVESNKRETLRIETFNTRIKSGDTGAAVSAVLDMAGVVGLVADIIKVPAKYRTAVEVAAGSRLKNVVVDNMNTAVKCVQYLKERKLGRAVFLPLDKLMAPAKKPLPAGCIGWLSALVSCDEKYSVINQYVLGSTACAEDINKAKEIARQHRVRIVTLDGDMIEASGAVVGGYYKSKQDVSMPSYDQDKKKLMEENLTYSRRIAELEAELTKLMGKTRRRIPENIEMERAKIDSRIKKLRDERRVCAETRLGLSQEISRIKIEMTKAEASFDNVRIQMEGFDKKEIERLSGKNLTELREAERSLLFELAQLGNVNLKSLDDFEQIRMEFDEFKKKLDQIVNERNSILDVMRMIEEKRLGTFNATLKEVAKHFNETYRELTGGMGSLELENPNSLDSGLLIKASPAGKKLLNMDAMSGGEKTLTAFAFLFAIQKHKPVPFYILDEADAALDKQNSRRIAQLLSKNKKETQFIVVTHNDEMIRCGDQVFGVSMEDGESKIFGIKLPEES